MRHFFRTLAALAMLAACADDPQTSGDGPQAADRQAPARDQIERAVFQRILDQVPAYASSRSDRALAACIDWHWVTLDRVPVRLKFSTYSGQGSDGPVSQGGLMRTSIGRCEEVKAQTASGCDCVKVAEGNEPVLRVPEEVMQRLMEEGNPRVLIKCRLPDGIILDVSARKCEQVGGTPR